MRTRTRFGLSAACSGETATASRRNVIAALRRIRMSASRRGKKTGPPSRGATAVPSVRERAGNVKDVIKGACVGRISNPPRSEGGLEIRPTEEASILGADLQVERIFE